MSKSFWQDGSLKMSVFTDRSAYGNPDPTGAGGVVYLGGYEAAPVLLKKEVNPHSNNFTRELAGIQISEGLDGGGGSRIL